MNHTKYMMFNNWQIERTANQIAEKLLMGLNSKGSKSLIGGYLILS